MKRHQGTNIHLIRQSRRVLWTRTFVSKLTWACLLNLKPRNAVTLMCVSDHCRREGNKIADGLAKQGARSQFIGPEPFCDFTKTHIRALFRQWKAA